MRDRKSPWPMLNVQEALKIIRSNIDFVGIEDISTTDSLYRILAEGEYVIKQVENKFNLN